MKRSAATYAAFWVGVWLGLDFMERRRRRAELDRLHAEFNAELDRITAAVAIIDAAIAVGLARAAGMRVDPVGSEKNGPPDRAETGRDGSANVETAAEKTPPQNASDRASDAAGDAD